MGDGSVLPQRRNGKRRARRRDAASSGTGTPGWPARRVEEATGAEDGIELPEGGRPSGSRAVMLIVCNGGHLPSRTSSPRDSSVSHDSFGVLSSNSASPHVRDGSPVMLSSTSCALSFT